MPPVSPSSSLLQKRRERRKYSSSAGLVLRDTSCDRASSYLRRFPPEEVRRGVQLSRLHRRLGSEWFYSVFTHSLGASGAGHSVGAPRTFSEELTDTDIV